jgi:hypothetical protein
MRKSTAERALIRASLDELRAEVAEQRALLLTLLVKIDGLEVEPPQVYDPADDTLTVADAAGILRVSAYTVRAMCNDGRLVASKESNAAGWRIDAESVRAEYRRRWDEDNA